MSDSPAPVVVGVDGSPSALSAARWAGAVANLAGAPLHLVHAVPYLGRNWSDAGAAIRAAAITGQQESAAVILNAVAEAVRADFGELAVITEEFAEPVDEVLTRLSRRARLIVLGCDELTAAGALLMGSTTLKVAAGASCPVVAWRGGAIAPTKQAIVVGVDGSRSGAAALAVAFELADLFDVPLHAVHSWSGRAPGGVTIPFLIDWDALEAAEWKLLTDAVDGWTTRYPDVEVTCFVEPTKPSRLLLNHLTDAQLILVGDRGRNVLADMFLGSTSLNMLHYSAVPVVLCRGDDHHQ